MNFPEGIFQKYEALRQNTSQAKYKNRFVDTFILLRNYIRIMQHSHVHLSSGKSIFVISSPTIPTNVFCSKKNMNIWLCRKTGFDY